MAPKSGTNVKPGSISPQYPSPVVDPAHVGQMIPPAVPSGWREGTKGGKTKVPK
jgi:hypothetical protein